MFANCSVFCDVRHVRSSVFGQNVMFGSVRSSVLLLCDQTSLGTYSLMFANCSDFCDVRHVRSSILGQNVMFRHSMFRVFEVRHFGVHCKTITCISRTVLVAHYMSHITSVSVFFKPRFLLLCIINIFNIKSTILCLCVIFPFLDCCEMPE